MANTKSAKKEIRKSRRKNEINKLRRANFRSAVKQFRALIASGEFDKAKAMLPKVISRIDRSVSKGILHRTSASRYKSRLSRAASKTASDK